MVLGKIPVPGRPTNSDDSRARAYCACNRSGWGWFGHCCCIARLITLCSIYIKGPLNPKQPTNPPSSRLADKDLDDLVPQLPSPFILLGD